jgi:hypothetical protein
MESKNTKSNYLDKLKPLVFAKDVTPPKTLRDVIVNIYVNKNNTFRIDKTGKYRVVGDFNKYSRRSAQDVYLVAKSYIKGITFGEVDTAITNLRRKGFLLGNFCHTCKRTVYSKHWTREIPLKLPE